jgi:hypothetical protein
MATVEALVHQGTWAIDDTVFGERTADRIYLQGHFYSSKPPVLSLLAATFYAVLHNVFQISFDFAGWCDPVVHPFYCFALLYPQSSDWGYYLLTLMLVGFPSALMLALFYKSTALCNISNPMALLVTGALGLGTLIFPYSLVFDNHVPAAVCLMVSLYALLRSRTGESNPWHFLMLAGFSTALAFTFDLVTGPFLVFFMGLAWVRHRRRAWPFLVGGLIPVMLLAVLDWWILGDPLPPHMHPAGYDYAGSLFSASVGGNQSASDVASYAFHMLFGDRGLFTFSLVMLWPVCGLVKVLFQKRHWLWVEAVAVGLASLVVGLYLVLFTDNFGGLAYGTRWFTAIIPVLFFFAVQTPLDRSWLWRLLFIALVVFSLVFTWQGALAPWMPTLPPAQFFRYIASPVGRYLESLPADAVSYTTLPHARYLPVYPLHAWHTSLRQFDPSLGVLPAGDPDRVAVYVISTDDQATGELLEAAFPSGQWDLDTEEVAVYRVSPDVDRVQPRQSLDVEFAGAIQLLGCDPPPDSLRPGDTVSVQLYWQALVPVRGRYTAFVHLLGPTNPSTGNPLWAQDDHQPGQATYPTDFWLPGEVVQDGFQLVVPQEAPPGEYMLSTGFYDLVTLQRLGRSNATGDTATLYHITVVP